MVFHPITQQEVCKLICDGLMTQAKNIKEKNIIIE